MSATGSKSEDYLFEALVWSDARKYVKNVNPTLTKIIDDIDPGKNFLLYRARYPYGASILDKSDFKIPFDDEIVSITDSRVPAELRDSLYYNNSVPMGMPLNNSIEHYLPIEDRIIPFSISKPGKIFSLWRTLSPKQSFNLLCVWGMTAGARSIFMLPKITEYNAHNRLKRELQIKSPAPKTLGDQFSVFHELSQAPDFPEKWFCDVLFFTKPWIEALNDPAWVPLHNYLISSAWDGSQFWRNKALFDLVFSRAQAIKNLRPNPYLADTVKHLFTMASGTAPSFGPAIDNKLGPIQSLEAIYRDVYNLKIYEPCLMAPFHFDLQNDERPGYYSLHHPTLLEFSPKSRSISSTIQDLHEIQHIMDTVMDEILAGKMDVVDSPIYHIASQLDIDCFHSELDRMKTVKPSAELLAEDDFLKQKFSSPDVLKFCDTSPFFRGCVRLKKK